MSNEGPLSYGLGPSVKYSRQDEAPLLTLAYPLKVIRLQPLWVPVFNELSRNRLVPFDAILSLVHPAPAFDVESFLNELVRKGFLIQAGSPKLLDTPTVSIIIPVRNRPEELRGCLESLRRLAYPAHKREVIVVDDASDDNTPATVSQFSARLIPLRERKGASRCRNLAASQATGEILAFIDSDCSADPRWLNDLIPAFRDTTLGALGGIVVPFSEEKALDRYEQVKSSLHMGSRYRSSREEGPFFYVPSCNLLVRKAPFIAIGGFREDLHVGEDVDFCWRLRDQGHKVEYRPTGKVYHRHRNELKPFCARRFDYGVSEPLLHHYHPERKKQLVFSFATFSFWLLLVFTLLSRQFLLVGLSGLLLLADACYKQWRLRRENLLLPFLRILLATARSYLGFSYHCCAFVSRYYLGCSFLFCYHFPSVTLVILGMHLFAGTVDFFIKRPSLNLLSYWFFFSFEQLAYQGGVWWGCLRRFSFNPVNPHIRFVWHYESP
jgi:mycofactocin glycosyltransferase